MKITEQDSQHRDLEKQSTEKLIQGIHSEDKKVVDVVGRSLKAIEKLVDAIYPKMKEGGRLFYLGAGTSGRLAILDASECPPTFGVPEDWVIGIIAGGDSAIRKAVEFAEDDTKQAWKDLQTFSIDSRDSVIGITASGTTPYVLGALQTCKQNHILTGSITCNPQAEISKIADYPIEIVTGPEFLTGSTRMKAGTATKMVLNMISTTLMIKLGRVLDNKMVDMQLANHKLIERGTKMVMEATGLEEALAKELLLQNGSVRAAVEAFLQF